MPVLISINGRITITDEQYIQYKLIELANCCHLMPSIITGHVFYNLIRGRADKAHWVKFFDTEHKKAASKRTEDKQKMKGIR